jgi:hypothetical protein
MKSLYIFSRLLLTNAALCQAGLSFADSKPAEDLSPARPIFPSTHSEPVLLRYKFKTGRTVKMGKQKMTSIFQPART